MWERYTGYMPKKKTTPKPKEITRKEFFRVLKKVSRKKTS